MPTAFEHGQLGRGTLEGAIGRNHIVHRNHSPLPDHGSQSSRDLVGDIQPLPAEHRPRGLDAVVRSAARFVVHREQDPGGLVVGEVRAMRLPQLCIHLCELIVRHVLVDVNRSPFAMRAAAPNPALVARKSGQCEEREEEESQDALPNLHNMRRAHQQNNDEPNVREDRPRRCAHVDGHVLDVPHLAIRKRDNADGDDHQQIERGTPDNSGRAKAL
mmetsp:Transcript_25397/g.73085  ORF Transcript_25397/g.73085 Transcript_25397/m.73085 type:complete len:216 (-) Transcript_25397:463-1110(-)